MRKVSDRDIVRREIGGHGVGGLMRSAEQQDDNTLSSTAANDMIHRAWENLTLIMVTSITPANDTFNMAYPSQRTKSIQVTQKPSNEPGQKGHTKIVISSHNNNAISWHNTNRARVVVVFTMLVATTV